MQFKLVQFHAMFGHKVGMPFIVSFTKVVVAITTEYK